MAETLQQIVDRRAKRLAEQKYNATLQSRHPQGRILAAKPTKSNVPYLKQSATLLAVRLADPSDPINSIEGATSRAQEWIKLLRGPDA